MNIHTHMTGKLILTFFMMTFILTPTITSYASDYHIIDITLETIYEDGEKAVEVRSEEVVAMEDLWGKYEMWHLVDMSEGKVIFRSQVKELSPLTTLSGYSKFSP